MHLTKKAVLQGAIIGGMVNGLINGIIYWFQVRGKEEVMVTDNLISSTEHTVFASAVPLATSLAFMLTSITFFTAKIPGKPPYFPGIFLLALRNAVFAFGSVVIFAILLQRYAGSIVVSPLVAVLITAAVAAVISAVVDYLTKISLHGIR